MSPATTPTIKTLFDEPDRLAELERTDLMNGEPEAAFDRITAQLAEIFGAPAAMMNLIDEDNQYIKSLAGAPSSFGNHRIIPRGMSICGHVVDTNQALVVEDLALDERFRDMPFVKEKGLRFYAGTPLRFEEGGAPIGALCIVDFKPRALSQSERKLLKLVAAGLMTEVKLRRVSKELIQRTRTMERDLAAARAVQRFLLPPQRQEGNGFILWHQYHPVDAIGGDFVDAQVRTDGSLAALVADVTGHGASAALTSAMVKTVFQHAAPEALGPAEILSSVQRDLSHAVENGQFLTAAAMTYDPKLRQARLALAGHPQPILLRNRIAQPVTTVTDLPLLVEMDQIYNRDTALQLFAGDRLLLYTDGAPESTDAGGQMLEMKGWLRMITDQSHLTDGGFLRTLFHSVRSFAGGKLKDDVALMMLELT